MHILVIASFHGVGTSVVSRDHVTSEDACPWPLENRALTAAVSSSSICIPCGCGAGGERGIGDLGLRRLEIGGVGGMCSERGCIRECAGAANYSRGRLLAPTGAGAVLLPKKLVRGIYLVVSSLAAVPYPPLHKGAARARWQSLRLADLGQWSAVHIPWCVVAFGAASRCRQAEPFTRDACR